MREQCSLARGLPSECRVQPAGVDRDQHEIGNARKMPGRSLLDLACAGEMDVAVTLVDAGAAERAGDLCVPPEGRIADLVDGVRHAPSLGLGASCATSAPQCGKYAAAACRVILTASF